MLLETADAAVGYGKPLLEHINMECDRGQFWGFLGANGIGKSTLLRALMGLQPLLSGSLSLDGRPLASLKPAECARLAALAGTGRAADRALTVTELVSIGRHPHTDWFGVLSGEDRLRVEQEIETFDLKKLARRSIDSLSDGESSRANAARAFSQDTPLVLMDEPLAFLDPPRKVELMVLLRRRAHDENRCVIATLHDMELALRWCDGLILAFGGQVCQGPPRQMVLQGALEQLYPDRSPYFDDYLREITSRVYQ